MAQSKARSSRGKIHSDPVLQSTANPLPGRLRRLVIFLFLVTTIPVLVLRWVPPPFSMFMLLDQASAFANGDWHYRVRYRWTPWRAISPHAKLAVMASEDQTFADHPGFDFKAMGRALQHNQSGRNVRGGSTITQQTAKNLFLYPGRSYVRKALEAYFTALIELSWPKERILEVYLNIAEFGQGIYGVGAGSRAFFGKPAGQLSSEQAALMAAVLPNPKLFSVTDPSDYLLKRQDWIKGQMSYLRDRHVLDSL